MPCPFASAAGAVTAIGGVHSLLFRDRRFRWLAWSTLVLLAAGWTGYFLAFRTGPARIALEVVSVAAVLVAALRVRHLMKVHGIVPPFYRPASRALRATWPVLGSPGVLAGKVWLLAMLVMEGWGRAHFTALEYGLVIAGTALLAVLRARSLRRAAAASAAAPATPPAVAWSPPPAAPDAATGRSPRHRGLARPASRPPRR